MVLALATVAVMVGVVTASPTSAPTAHAQALAAGGEFHALPPARIFDTRPTSPTGTAPGKKATTPQGSSFDVTLLGQKGIPANPGDVLAVVLNVTVANPDQSGYLSIRPRGGGGESSLVNFERATDVPNLAIVGVGTEGKATVTLTSPYGSGTANVIVDVFGWISTSNYGTAGARFVPVGPGRILDTRTSPVPSGWPSGRMVGGGEQIEFPIRGADSSSPNITDIVPNNNNVTGVMVNVTVVNDGGQITYVAATPERTPAGRQPSTSITNLAPGQNKANTAIIPVGADGKIRIFNSHGGAHVIVDVLGYFTKGQDPAKLAGRIIPLSTPFRAFDTRQPAFGRVPLGSNATEDWSFTSFAGSVKVGSGTVGKLSAVIGNLTATELGRSVPSTQVRSFLTAFPGSSSRPNSSNVNVEEGETVPNMSLFRFGSVNGDANVVKVRNDAGSLHYIFDVYAVVLAD